MKIDAQTNLSAKLTKFEIDELIRKEAAQQGLDVSSLDWKVVKNAEGKVTRVEVTARGISNKNYKGGK